MYTRHINGGASARYSELSRNDTEYRMYGYISATFSSCFMGITEWQMDGRINRTMLTGASQRHDHSWKWSKATISIKYVVVVVVVVIVVVDLVTGVPPHALIQYPRFTAARKKIWNLKKSTVHKFQNARQARMGRNMVKSSSPNAPSTWLIFLAPPVHTLPSRTCFHSASSVLAVGISCRVIAVCYTNITLYIAFGIIPGFT
jgi:hypothetical protein